MPKINLKFCYFIHSSNQNQNAVAHSQQAQQNQNAAQVQHQQAQLQTKNEYTGQQQPQVITLQQLQNFLPTQQIQTITSADGHQVCNIFAICHFQSIYKNTNKLKTKKKKYSKFFRFKCLVHRMVDHQLQLNRNVCL